MKKALYILLIGTAGLSPQWENTALGRSRMEVLNQIKSIFNDTDSSEKTLYRDFINNQIEDIEETKRDLKSAYEEALEDYENALKRNQQPTVHLRNNINTLREYQNYKHNNDEYLTELRKVQNLLK